MAARERLGGSADQVVRSVQVRDLLFGGASATLLLPVARPFRVLSFFPGAAQDLLRGKDSPYQVVPNDEDTGLRPWTCSELVTGETRKLSEIFSKAGFEEEPLEGELPHPEDTYINYRFRALDPIADIFISFEPILPHGQWSLMGG
jgi:hypothetical protein